MPTPQQKRLLLGGRSGPAPLVLTGTYTGNGSASRVIPTGSTHPPVAVIVKKISGAAGQNACIYIKGMSVSRSFVGSGPGSAILALNADGSFTIGSSDYANTAGAQYVWIALLGTATNVQVGTYTGDGTTGRTIAHNLPSAPIFVMTVADGAGLPAVFKTSAISGTSSIPLTTSAQIANGITALGASNFTIGAATGANQNTTPYAWIAIASDPLLAVGTFTNGASPANPNDVSTGLTSAISAAFVKANAATAGNLRTKDFGDNSSALVTNVLPASNAIERFNSGGILELGSDASVNPASLAVYWVAFGTPGNFS